MKIINKQLLPVGTFDAPDAAITLQFTADEPTLVLDLTLEQPAPAPEPEPPADVVTASFTASADGLTATVTDQSTSSGGTVTDVLVNWEGTISDELTPGGTASHTYAVAGTYTIILTAKDDHGVIGTAQQSVDVVGVVTPPQGGSGQVRVTGKLADGTTIDVSLDPGERIPLVAGTLNGSVIFHADGKSVCLENGYMGLTGPLVGHFTLTNGGSPLFDGDLTIGGYKRTRPFWLVQPVAKVAPDWSGWPKYGDGQSAGMYDSYMKADNGPMGRGLANPDFGTPGARADLSGPLWDIAYLTNPTPENAIVVRGMSDAAAIWGVHAIDPATNEMVDMTGNPPISMNGNLYGQGGNPIVAFAGDGSGLSLAQAQAHATNFSLVAAELYGTDYDREEVGFWANYYGSIWQGQGYRLPGGGFGFSTHYQVRGKARGLFYLVMATQYAPAKWRPLFSSWVRDLAADGKSRWLSQPGLQIDHDFQQQSATSTDYEPWCQYLLIGAIGTALDHGFTEFQEILDYFAVVPFQAILGDGNNTPAIQHEFASSYTFRHKHADGTRVADWRDACVAQAAYSTDFANAFPLPEDSLERMKALYPNDTYLAGDFAGYPWSPTGYPSMMRVGLVAIARHATDQTRAQAAWAKFLKHYRADHSTDPKFCEMP